MQIHGPGTGESIRCNHLTKSAFADCRRHSGREFGARTKLILRSAAKGGGAMRRALSVCAMMVAAVLLAACGTKTQRVSEADAPALTGGGNPHRGQAAMRRYGCNACHTIPGVAGARGNVGPPLAGIGSRVYIAGVMSNTPANLVHWIENPPGVDSLTAMPNLGVTERDARDIAAYLYSLR